jgi:ferritin-like protein
MEEPEEIVIQKRQAAIKLAKNLEPFNHALGQEFDAVYVETLTEDIKQLARELKKLAKVVAVYQQSVQDKWTNEERPLKVIVDEEEEPVTKLMRRYCTRIQKMSDLIYEVAYMDFEGLEQQEIKQIMDEDEEEDE